MIDRTIAEAAREVSRQLRTRMTESERILWNEPRNRKLLGKKFLRQHPLFCQYEGKAKFFVADFYCHEHRLVLEADGKSHEYQKEYDELRTFLINTKRIQVVRFKNEEIQHSLSGVLEQLRQLLLQRHWTHPPQSPFPKSQLGKGDTGGRVF